MARIYAQVNFRLPKGWPAGWDLERTETRWATSGATRSFSFASHFGSGQEDDAAELTQERRRSRDAAFSRDDCYARANEGCRSSAASRAR